MPNAARTLLLGVLSLGLAAGVTDAGLAKTVHKTAPKAAAKAPAKKEPAAKAEPRQEPKAEAKAETPALAPPALPPAEIEHRKRYDAAIAPVRDYALSERDAQGVRDAFAAIAKNDFTKAQTMARGLGDPVARTLVEWQRLRSANGSLEETRAFLDAHPDWPDRGVMTRHVDELLFRTGGSSAAIKANYGSKEPENGAGLAALASAYLAEGDQAKAKALAVKAWREKDIPAALEQGFLARFGAFLSAEDHKQRIDRLLSDAPETRLDRSERLAAAKRIVPLLGAAEQAKAQARLAWGGVLTRVQSLRHQKKRDEAAKLLLSVPTGPGMAVNADGFWAERRSLAFAMLDAGRAQEAYALVKEVSDLSVNPAKEQTFTAGWIALRFLKDPKSAAGHFGAMAKFADGPLSRAKAGYWQGRAAEAQGDKVAAKQHYERSARETDTFHGELARQKLDPGAQPFDIAAPAAPSEAELAHFRGSEVAKAVIVAHKAKLTPGIEQQLLHRLRDVLDSNAETAMGAHLADSLGDYQTAVRIGKAAIARGQNLFYYSYPMHPYPGYSPIRTPPELALLLGVARQESEFYTQTISKAGAQGLLQVMKVTARQVCTDHNVKCDLSRLLNDKPYNTMMASAYIADRQDEFTGSYVLTLASYNAGPGRAHEWIKAYGDPRTASVDPIDWIERLPFQETREYVAKVLSNIQVYRARIGQDDRPLRLAQDLERGRAGKTGAAAAAAD